MGSTPEPAIRSSDQVSDQIWSADILFWQLSIDHNIDV